MTNSTAHLQTHPKTFSEIDRERNVVSRVVTAACWIEEGAYDEAHGCLLDLEDELLVELEDERRLAA